jgi:hypothetical protein
VAKVGTSKIIRFNSTSDRQDLLVRRLVVGGLNSKGSSISHLAVVHPGALATGSPQKEEEEPIPLLKEEFAVKFS